MSSSIWMEWSQRKLQDINLMNEIRWDLKYNLLRITNVAWWVQMKMMKYVVKIQIFLSPPSSCIAQARADSELTALRSIELSWIQVYTVHVSNTEIKFYPEFNGFQKFVQFTKTNLVSPKYLKFNLQHFLFSAPVFVFCFPSVSGSIIPPLS